MSSSAKLPDFWFPVMILLICSKPKRFLEDGANYSFYCKNKTLFSLSFCMHSLRNANYSIRFILLLTWKFHKPESQLKSANWRTPPQTLRCGPTSVLLKSFRDLKAYSVSLHRKYCFLRILLISQWLEVNGFGECWNAIYLYFPSTSQDRN